MRLGTCRFRLFALAFLCAGSFALCSAAWGQSTYPAKPINLLIGFSPGGTTEITERFLAGIAKRYLEQPFVITNNGGGGSAVAAGIVAKKPPDGYNILGATSSTFVRIPQFTSVPYSRQDFVPIMHYASPQSYIAVKSSSPWKTLRELVDYARNNPGKVTYSTMGIGSPMHLAMEYIAKKDGVNWIHVPYPGTAPALTALLGGHVTADSGSGDLIPYAQDGTLRLLASQGERRSRTFPDVPTMRELGYDFINETVFMFAAPKGTPREIVSKLDDAFRKSMADPDFKALMAKLELETTYRNSADTAKYLEDAYVRIGEMIRDLKTPTQGNQNK
jgi:tripartite-type tricarboxylate transporter receptor subunit TctC